MKNKKKTLDFDAGFLDAVRQALSPTKGPQQNIAQVFGMRVVSIGAGWG